MARPKLILMDEPSMGLSPRFVEAMFAIIQQIRATGVALFIVEQNAQTALRIADRGYVLQMGAVVLEGEAGDLLNNQAMQRAYLGHA